MQTFDILKIEKMNSGGEHWIAVQLHDKKNNFTFWIDCGMIDGYGNKDPKKFKTDDLYIDWDFNQYIFILDNEKDLHAKKYQEDPENIDSIQYFIDEKNDYLIKILKNMEEF